MTLCYDTMTLYYDTMLWHYDTILWHYAMTLYYDTILWHYTLTLYYDTMTLFMLCHKDIIISSWLLLCYLCELRSKMRWGEVRWRCWGGVQFPLPAGRWWRSAIIGFRQCSGGVPALTELYHWAELKLNSVSKVTTRPPPPPLSRIFQKKTLPWSSKPTRWHFDTICYDPIL